MSATSSALVQFRSREGQDTGPQLTIPVDVNIEQLNLLVNRLLSNEESQPYSFYVDEEEIQSSLQAMLEQKSLSTEQTLHIVYQPQAMFRVRSVTRCTASIPGHAEAVLSVSFSPDGRRLASGSGDTTVRVWDITTQSPRFTLSGHKNWVLCIAWSPDGRTLASGSNDNTVQLWDPDTGKALGPPLKGHTRWVTALAWEPLHLNAEANRLASSSKDGTVRVWDTARKSCLFTLSSHTDAISCLRWGGDGLIYTGSRDRTIKVWDGKDGKMCRSLDGHAHWINTLALNTDYVLRTGAHDHNGDAPQDRAEAQEAARKRYEAVRGAGKNERLISGSDDFTMFLWEPAVSKKPLARLTGHMQLVNHVCFSPDGAILASGSFDKSVKLWDGFTGKFIGNLRGHVGAVYQVAWSSDSRLLVSASKDSTLKVWDMRTKKLKFDLPGHADEVYAVDWSPDGEKVASGGKDKIMKLWGS